MGELARVAFDVFCPLWQWEFWPEKHLMLSSLAMGELARVAFDVVLSSLAMGELARVAFDNFCPLWPWVFWPE